MDKRIEEFKERLNRDKKVIALALFGSSTIGKGRDIDLCIFLDKKYSNLEMSQLRLKYLKDFDFDIQIFQQLPLYIRKRVLKEAKYILIKDFDRLFDIAIETIKEYEMYKKAYFMYLEGLKNG